MLKIIVLFIILLVFVKSVQKNINPIYLFVLSVVFVLWRPYLRGKVITFWRDIKQMNHFLWYKEYKFLFMP
jgi:hypothetical protein